MKKTHPVSPASLMMLVACLAIGGCGDSGPDLTVSDVQIIAPAPGRSASVAYMTIRNMSGDTVVINSISSPQFGRVELHETRIVEGIAIMQAIGKVEIPANSAVEFSTGGKHVMLLEPKSGLLPGKSISLQLDFGSGELLLVEAPLTTRAAAAD